MLAETFQITPPYSKRLLTGIFAHRVYHCCVCIAASAAAQLSSTATVALKLQALKKTALARRAVVPWGCKAPLAPPKAVNVEPPQQVHEVALMLFEAVL